MTGALPWRILVCLAILSAAVYSEVCHVQPHCNCFRRNDTNITCDIFSVPYIPFLGFSDVRFHTLKIRGGNLQWIGEGTFGGLTLGTLDIQHTGISHLNCDTFSGISDSLSNICLSNNLLTRVPDCALAKFTSSVYLDLVNNSIFSLETDNFLYLTNLQRLELRANRIYNIDHGAFRGLGELTTLDLSHNNISVLNASVFDGLRKLEALKLNHNQLVDLGDKVFSDIMELRILNIDNNRLAFLEDNLLGGLIKLEKLYIRNNNITRISHAAFQNLGQLRYLDLSENNINRLLPKTFKNLANLYSLDLEWNSLTEIAAGIFTGLSAIRRMHLGHNKIVGINMYAFIHCPEMLNLNLTDCLIQYIPPGVFRNLPLLSTLDLSSNKLMKLEAGVFYNLSRLNTLSLRNNQISFLSEVIFYEIVHSLYELDIRRNSLSYTSWTWLGTLLGHLKGLRILHLSDNPLKYIPMNVLPILETMMEANLRNCSLDEVPGNVLNVSGDFSMNRIEGPVTLRTNQGYNPKFNVSNNNITALNIKLKLVIWHGLMIVSDNSKMCDSMIVEIDNQYINFSYYPSVVISARNNSFSEPIPFLFRGEFRQGFGDLHINLDFSDNVYLSLTQLPLNIKVLTLGEIWSPCNTSSHLRIYVDSLDMSGNAISYISPEACLGAVQILDLRNNHLEVMDKLMDSTDSSAFRLKYLDLSGNRIYQATAEAFHGHYLFYTVDLRDNQIVSLQSFKPMLTERKYYRLSLSGNPLACGCEIAWLRNNSVHENLGSIRCQAPQNFVRFLAWCFPLTGCPAMSSVSVTDKTKEICKDDSHIELSNLTVAVERDDANVTWTKTGPGTMTGVTVEYYSVDNVDVKRAILVHPEMEFVVLTDLLEEKVYNICVAAVLHSEIKNPAVCAIVKTTDAGVNIIIFLATALGVCILLVLFLMTCVCLQKRSHKYDPGTSNNYAQKVAAKRPSATSTNMSTLSRNMSIKAETSEETVCAYI
ncbi:toll-like receptor 6 [Liolophura sinensis]|uniref:toll-like receptor 6 n=1 Tax=Liolophura sinensis TaxID=3198878 RepID=UPI00315987F2